MKRLLGLLGWLGVVLVLLAVVIRFAKPELQPWYQGLALAGLVATGLYALSQWRDIGRSFQGRNVRYGSVAVGSVLLFLAILGVINWIGKREHKRWDLTLARQFTMSDQTKKILTGLTKPVAIHVFYDKQSSSLADFKDKLGEYEYLSGQVKATYSDANFDPVEARKYNIQQLPTIVFEYDGRTERTSSTDEQGITNALKKVIEGQAKKVYFSLGHGEHNTDDAQGKTGYAGIAAALKNDNFEIAKVTLAQEGKVPDDASVLVVAGPKSDYLPPEVDLLRGYLRRGGKLLLFLDPPDKPDAAPVTNLIAFAKEWGIDVGTNVVVDTSGLGQLFGANEAVPIAMPPQGSSHPITKDFQMMTAYPLARSVTPIEGGANGHTAQKLVETSARSWAETDLKGLYANGKVEPNPDKGDKMGPISLAAAVSAAVTDAPGPGASKQESRLVVVGDSDFMSNGAINTQGNRDLGLNMANWLAQQEDMIAIRPRDAADRRITMTNDQGFWTFVIAIFIIPGLLFLSAFVVWWKRR
jgi:ABC-type uncharacterized transport system involved in gliding motility auxiliary subunit